jgi:sugar/nucleoside kinase (ribokinase family)
MKGKGFFAGLVTVDIQFLVPSYPSPNTKVKASRNEVCIGGPATNAAIVYACLGGHPVLYTGIGNHHFTELIKKELEERAIQFTDIKPACNFLPTFASIITSSDTGDRTVFSHHPGNLKAVDLSMPDNMDFANVSFVMLDGFYMDFSIRLAKNAKENAIPVILDGGSWKEDMEKLLPLVDVAICSNDFFPPGTSDAQEVLEYLSGHVNIKNIAITRGEAPILFSLSGKQGELPVEPVKVVDTLGAGDVFHGAFCYYFEGGGDFLESLKNASRVAGKSCQFFGTRAWMND